MKKTKRTKKTIKDETDKKKKKKTSPGEVAEWVFLYMMVQGLSSMEEPVGLRT